MFKKIRKVFKSKEEPIESQVEILNENQVESLVENAVENPVETEETPTLPFIQKSTELVEEPVPQPQEARLPQFIVGCAQSVGMVRDHNEDSILVLSALTANNRDYLPIGLFIVADGMGGHKFGEVASNIAVRTLAREVLERVIFGLFDTIPAAPEQGIQEILEESVLQAHKLITKEAPGGGTTLTAALVIDKLMSIAHVGDSRAYSINLQGQIDVLTRDHSLVKRMMELGHLTEAEASVHPQRNVLYRALGQGEPFSPDISTTPVPAPGYLLLCSDGLWGQVPQDEIARLVLSTPSPETACQLLIDAANEAGGPDNISAILVQLPETVH